MGALHEGHRSLMRAARAESGLVVVSVFVNPTQFGPNEDFAAYPRPLEADLAACRAERVDAVFLPEVAEMYPPNAATCVSVSRITEVLCGASRPGHFNGVTTVVNKLFNIVQPDLAYFGQKDAQQVVVIRTMVADLNMAVTVRTCPIVREPDGLAMSSRNAYLSPAERSQAVCLSAALAWARAEAAAGRTVSEHLVEGMRGIITAAGPCLIDYLACVDPETLSPLTSAAGPTLLAVAVRIGPARLIDNCLLNVDGADRCR